MSPLVRQKWPWSRRNLTDGLFHLGTLQIGTDRRRRANRELSLSVVQLEDRTLPTTIPTLTQLASSLTSLTYGQADQFTATVTTNPASSTTPSGGSVSFMDGSNLIGSASLMNGVAALTIDLPAGSHEISAIYGGNTTYGSSTNTISTTVITTLNIQSISGSNGTGGSALSAALNQPRGIAVDASGNVFIADTDHNQIREVLASSGIIVNIAGTGTAGDTGDGGLATAAQIDQPTAIALDVAGNIFFADAVHSVIREVNHATGNITTVAGSGTAGDSGDGSFATEATLNNPTGIAVDANDNIFIADSNNDVIREVNHSTGIITTVAGNATPGFSGDGGRATAAQLYQPSGIALDANDDLFIADTDNNVIRYVDASSHIMSTLAGNHTLGYSGDGGNPTAAELANPYALVLDSSGDLFISDTANDAIREISSATGLISTVAGNGSSGTSGAGGSATSAELDEPSGIAVDSAGDLFISDTWANVIDSVSATTGTLTVVAGDGSRNGSGSAPGQGLNNPTGIAIDSAGNLYVADTDHNVIREVLASSGTMIVVAGNGTAGYAGNGGLAVNAELNSPTDIAVDSAGDLFIADTANNVVRYVDASTHNITTLVGTGNYGYYGDGGSPRFASLTGPTGLAVDSAGDLFIADSGNNVIRELSATTGLMSTVAGNGTGGYSGDGSAATNAQLNFPISITLDSAGDLFIADSGNNAIREVNAATGNISTLAGNGTAGYAGDGSAATNAELNSPTTVAVDSSGNLYITDTFNSVIREVNATTGLISTIAGNGTAGGSGDGGQATAAELSSPYGLTIDSSGNLYITDGDTDSIRELSSSQISSPQPVTVAPAQLTLTANNLTKTYGAALPTLTYTVSGFVNNDTASILTGSPVLSTAAAASSRVTSSPYTITIAVGTLNATSNYTFSTITNGSLTITTAPLTITAPSVSKQYGASLPSLALTQSNYSGLVNGDTPLSLTTPPTVNTTATVASHVTSTPYAVTVSGATDPDYTITYVQGALTVTAAPLTITAPSVSKQYGASLPALILTTSNYSGLVNGDTPSSLTTPPTVTTTATVASHVTSTPYPVTVSGAVDSDYAITYVQGLLTVTSAPLTITAPSVTKQYGASLPALILTTSNYSGLVNGDTPSSLTTLPTVTTTATVASHVTSTPYVVTVSGALDSDYAITYVQGSLTVTAAPLTITAPSATKQYGASLPSLILTASNYSGLVNGDTPSSLTTLPTVTTTATVASHVTSTPYVVTVSGAVDSDYAITYVQGSLSVTAAPLTITAPSVTKQYGASLPALILTTSNYSGLVNGDTPSSLTTPPTVTTTATAASHVTSTPYVVTVSGAVDSDYTITYVQGSLSVTAAPLTITAPSATKQYGASLPSLILTASNYSGLVNGDTPSSLTTLPTVTTTATVASHVTSTPYVVTVSGAVDSDYAITYVQGLLTVTSAPLTITAPSVTKQYGASLPALILTASNYSGLVNGDTPSSLTTLPTVTTTATVASHVMSSPYPVTVSGAVDPDYTITYMQGSLTVTAAPLTITAPSVTKQYGASLPSLILTASNYSGLVNGDTPSSLATPPTVTTTATVASHVMSSPYPVTVSGAVDPDYTITYMQGSLTVTAAPLTITAPSVTKQYGASLPSLALTQSNYSGLVNGDTPSSLATPPTVTTTATVASHVTSTPYAVTVSGAVDSDYAITYVQGALTITPVPLAITAPSATSVYGSPLPNLTLTAASYSGFVNGDTYASLTTQPAVTTTASQFSPVQSAGYAITASGAIDPDYTIVYNTGTLTITQATTTATVTLATGSTNPSSIGQSVTFVVTIAPVSPGQGTPTGSVEFYDNNPETTGQLISGVITLSNGQATFTTSSLSINNHAIYAIFSGSANFVTATSPTYQQSVVSNPTTTTVTRINGTTNVITYGQSINLQVSVSTGNATTATGTVLLLAGNIASGDTLLGTATLDASATAQFSIAGLHANTYSIYAEYQGAGSTPGSISTPISQTVAPAPLTITAPNASKQYGSPLPALILTTSDYSGFVNGDIPASLTTQPTVTTTATASSHVTPTPYPVTATGALDPDYTITYTPGQLTVTPAPLTITAPSVTKQYGATLPTLILSTSNYSGLVNQDTPASLTTQPTVTTTATASSHVTTTPYPVTATGALDPDYTITYAPGQLTVTPAPLTITAPNATKQYGATLPALMLTTSNYSGLVNQDTPASLTTQPTVATTATASSHVTTTPYPVTATGPWTPTIRSPTPPAS